MVFGLQRPAWGNRVSGLRHSTSSDRVRLVVDLQTTPLYQVYPVCDPPSLVVEVLDATPSNAKPGKCPNTFLLNGWKVENPTIRSFRWTIALNSALPNDQYSVQVLDKPCRLVVDLSSKWIAQESYSLTKNVTWVRREIVGGDYGYLLWNQLVVDPQAQNVKVDVGLANGNMRRCAPLSEIVRSTGAIAGINGGYFNPAGGALGLVVREGKLVSPHVSRRPPRTAMALTDSGQVKFARALVKDGQVKTVSGQSWNDARVVLGGGPNLLSHGAFNITTDLEELGPSGNDITRSCGRTAVGTTPSGKLVLATASGYRSSHAQGVKLPQMARMLYAEGVKDAMNLDGGGSVDMSIAGEIVANGPKAGSYERPIATALLIFDSSPSTYPARLQFTDQPKSLPANGTSSTPISVEVLAQDGLPVADGTTVAFRTTNLVCNQATATTKNGIATINVLSVRKPGRANITAISGFAKAMHCLDLLPDQPNKIIVDVSQDIVKAHAPALPTQTEAVAPETISLVSADDKAAPATEAVESTGPDQQTRVLTLTVLVEDQWHNGLGYTPVNISYLDAANRAINAKEKLTENSQEQATNDSHKQQKERKKKKRRQRQASDEEPATTAIAADRVITTEYSGQLQCTLEVPISTASIRFSLDKGVEYSLPLSPIAI